MADAAERRWFRFSLRTLLVAITVAAVWLGWNANIVRQRRALIGDKKGAANNVVKRPTNSLPWVRRLMGDESVRILTFDRASEEELDRAKRLFPEAAVLPVVRYPGSD